MDDHTTPPINLNRSLEELDAFSALLGEVYTKPSLEGIGEIARQFRAWGFGDVHLSIYERFGFTVRFSRRGSGVEISWNDYENPVEALFSLARELLREQYALWLPKNTVNFELPAEPDPYLHHRLYDFLDRYRYEHRGRFSKGYVHPETYHNLRMMRGTHGNIEVPMFPPRLNGDFAIADIPIEQHHNIPENVIMFTL